MTETGASVIQTDSGRLMTYGPVVAFLSFLADHAGIVLESAASRDKAPDAYRPR